MATTTGDVWVPTTEAEKKAKEAFESLNTSLDGAILRTETGEPAKFILHSKGYFDLKNYIDTGRTFPKTDDEFDKQISKVAFRKLTDADPDIHGTTRKTMVEIGSSCSDFGNKHLSSLITCAQEAIHYSDNATEWLSNMQDLNLRAQLEILFDPKYTSKEAQDDAYRAAFETADASLSVLKSEALEKKEATKHVLDALLNFQNLTLTAHTDMKDLIQQYETGPVKRNEVTKIPFLKYLNEDLDTKKKALETLIAQQDAKFSTWKLHAKVACGSAFVPMLGLICMAVTTGFAVARRKEYEALVEQVNKAKRDNEEETNLIEFVTKMITQGKDIKLKMEAAITAMQELHDLFSNQSACYDKIASYLTGMKAGVKLESVANRKGFVMNCLNGAVGKLAELKKVAQEFVNNAVHSIDLTKTE
ncbi:hypothetical protein N0V86_009882 [Didymella sp. IMI 355093]|nr:hypothetical protein N0V86_009882 [Didymella sp. IMI 355093]